MPDIDLFLQTVLIWAIPMLLAITLHEAAHAFAAKRLGDPTAEELGRLSLNPLRHVDPFGTVVLPLILLATQSGFVFGYAKPVPVNARRLRNPRWGMALVALAGPGSNLVQAAIAAILLVFALNLDLPEGHFLFHLLIIMIYFNCLLAVFNMLPVPPLDGGRVLVALLPPKAGAWLEGISRKGVLVLLALFILVPLLNREMGLDFDPFGYLIVGPARALMHLLLWIAGL